jgi:hypothetical protein
MQNSLRPDWTRALCLAAFHFAFRAMTAIDGEHGDLKYI